MGNWSSSLPSATSRQAARRASTLLLGQARHVQQAEVAVDGGRRPFHQSQGVDQLRRERPAGNGEVFHGPLRLWAVVRLGRQADLAHRIALGAELSHGETPGKDIIS